MQTDGREKIKSVVTIAEFTLCTNWFVELLGHGVLRQAAFFASHFQKDVGNLMVSNLVTANMFLIELKALSPEIAYVSPKQLANTSYHTFSDASQGKSSYGHM